MSSGISEFNTQTGLIVSDNSEYPAIGTLECNPCSGGGGGGGANVIGIRSSNGAPSTDLAAVVTNGLQYSGGAGGTLQILSDPAPTLEPATLSQVIATGAGIKLASTNAPAAGLVYSMNAAATGYEWISNAAAASMNGVVSRQGNASTDAPVLFNNGIKYTPAATAGGLIDILAAPTAGMTNTATTGGEQFLSNPNGIQLRATNTPASVGADAVFTYKSATTNYTWEAPAPPTGGAVPIGCIIMWGNVTAPITQPTFPWQPDGPGTPIWNPCDGGTYNGITTPDLKSRFVANTNTYGNQASGGADAVGLIFGDVMGSQGAAINGVLGKLMNLEQLVDHQHYTNLDIQAGNPPVSGLSTDAAGTATAPTMTDHVHAQGLSATAYYLTTQGGGGFGIGAPDVTNPIGLPPATTGGMAAFEWTGSMAGGGSAPVAPAPYPNNLPDHVHQIAATTGDVNNPVVHTQPLPEPPTYLLLYIIRTA